MHCSDKRCGYPAAAVQISVVKDWFSFEIVSIAGLSTHTINSIRANKAAKTLSMEIHVPKATARGRYHMQ